MQDYKLSSRYPFCPLQVVSCALSPFKVRINPDWTNISIAFIGAELFLFKFLCKV